MWKKADDEIYKRLYSMKKEGFFPVVGYPALVCLIFVLIYTRLDIYSDPYSPVNLIIVFSLTGLVLILSVLQICFSVRERKLRRRLASGNNAEYAGAELLLKYEHNGSRSSERTSGKLFGAAVLIDGRKLDVGATGDVYDHAKPGDTVYLVDLIGEKAKNPRTCIAVTKAELGE